MPKRKGMAEWQGGLRDGKGTVELGSGAFKGPYSFGSRFEAGEGTNPEELIGAAHAGCFTMALAGGLEKAGYTPTRIATTANVSLVMQEDRPTIDTITLDTEADVPEISDEAFQEEAVKAREGCLVSRALAGVEITLNARLAR